MTYNLELLRADVEDELKKVARLEEEFAKVEVMFDATATTVSFYDRSAIGYILHNFYNGCENIFKAIARFFENDIGPDSWHSDLLSV